MQNHHVLDVRNLHVHFPVRTGILKRTTDVIKAVDGVSLHVAEGETLGLVGESGCGKSTFGRAVLRLIPASDGDILFREKSILNASSSELKSFRRNAQIVFQDPGGSLNPRMKIGEIIGEPMRVHRIAPKSDVGSKVGEMLERCGLDAEHATRYPHELSGGQRQRVAVARALAVKPQFIVCDEPTSALDVSVQAQILNLLKDLQDEFHLSYLFISHDIGVVHHMCDRIAVMFNGKIIEQGNRDEVIDNPQHNYTKRLLAAVPHISV